LLQREAEILDIVAKRADILKRECEALFLVKREQ
jgi:hypothetical protein